MCTVTIHRGEGGLLVTMNRDELLSRGPEDPPRVFHGEEGAPDWMAPLDTDAGGTWMGANAHGVIACLLNAYLPEDASGPLPPPSKVSRGTIVPQVLARGPMGSMVHWFRNAFDPTPYAAFTLLLICEESARKFQWHRVHGIEEWNLDGEWNMVTSALFYLEEIREFREEQFEIWCSNGHEMIGNLPGFNILQAPGHEDRSPLVSRDWSGTRSITQGRLDREGGVIEMRYWPNPRPEGGKPSSLITLPLAGRMT